jgi:STE24 endopeptidase
MSRVLLLSLFMLWFTWAQSPEIYPAGLSPGLEMALFFGFYLLLVLVMGLWARLLARRVDVQNLHRSLRRFHRVIAIAHYLIPAWFAAGLFVLGWGQFILDAFAPLIRWSIHTPAAIVGTLPAVLTWCGLYWSAYPADRAMREHSLLVQLDQNLPIHHMPRFSSYLLSNIRVQVLFVIVPVVLIFIFRDAAGLALSRVLDLRDLPAEVLDVAFVPAAALISIFAPALLRRILQTQPLPDSALRRRLEAICQRHGLRYREILLWQTDNNLGNAAVMGIVPRFRYILLSDLLLETMTDRQIEAVFAHEVGHIVHRHMAWYLVFVGLFLLLSIGPADWLVRQVPPEWQIPHLPTELIGLVISLAGFLAVFGFISRRFERQADVFAARTLDTPAGEPAIVAPVRPDGAGVFASALHRVAVINNIPIAARSWCHGSIAMRMQYLQRLATDPRHTTAFDRFMTRLYTTLLTLLAMSAMWVVIMEWTR